MFLQRVCKLLLLLYLIQLVYLAAGMRSSTSGRSKTKQNPHTVEEKAVSETRVVLKCVSSFELVRGAQWTKDGWPLEEIATAGGRVKIYAANVTIEPILPEDEGVYRCNDGEELHLTGTFNIHFMQFTATV